MSATTSATTGGRYGLEQVLGGSVGQLAHADVVDDEQGHAGQLGQIVLAGVGERGLGELFEERESRRLQGPTRAMPRRPSGPPRAPCRLRGVPNA